jgi:hypothetical protein
MGWPLCACSARVLQFRLWPIASPADVGSHVGNEVNSGLVVRSAGRPARSRGCKSLAGSLAEHEEAPALGGECQGFPNGGCGFGFGTAATCLNGIGWPRDLSAMSYLWITLQSYHSRTTREGGSAAGAGKSCTDGPPPTKSPGGDRGCQARAREGGRNRLSLTAVV